MKSRDTTTIRLLSAGIIFLIVWAALGTFVARFVYWENVTPIWNDESVVNLRRFLVLRCASFLVCGASLVAIILCARSVRIQLGEYIAVTLVLACLSNLGMLLFIPESSPIQILHYRTVPWTQYAKGFHPSDFLSISIGMTKTEVEEMIGFGGVPFCGSAARRGDSVWRYSGPGGENHWRYWLTFSGDDKVQKVDVEYWWD